MGTYRVKGTGGAGKVEVSPAGIAMNLREGTRHNQGMIPRASISTVNKSDGLFSSTVEVVSGVQVYRWTLGKGPAKHFVSEIWYGI